MYCHFRGVNKLWKVLVPASLNDADFNEIKKTKQIQQFGPDKISADGR